MDAKIKVALCPLRVLHDDLRQIGMQHAHIFVQHQLLQGHLASSPLTFAQSVIIIILLNFSNSKRGEHWRFRELRFE